MEPHEVSAINSKQPQIVFWLIKYTGVPLALVLFLSITILLEWGTLNPFTGFLWLLCGYQFVSSCVRIGLDLWGKTTTFMTAFLEEKSAIAYRGKRKEYSIIVKTEFEVRTFEINQAQWKQLEIGVLYQIKYLKFSRLVLNIEPIPALENTVIFQKIYQTEATS